MIAHTDLERLLVRLPSMEPAQARQLLLAMTAQIKQKSAEDGLFWLRFVSTRDEADTDRPVKPFPNEEYAFHIWNLLAKEKVVIGAKSRQMLVSWILACFCVWWARHKPHQGVYWQTKKWEDAVAAVCMPVGGVLGRCQFIEDNLPTWMRVPYKPSEGRMQYQNGSVIQALAGGADQVRGKTISVLVEDEFAFQDDQDGVLTTVLPLSQKGAKIFFVSTPNGSTNAFATIYHGHPVMEASAE